MAKIVITLDGKVLQETPLLKDHITIGRRPHNDVVIDDPAVSAEHAVVVTILDDSFLEDLNSTNGTRVNGQPIKKHFLQDDDLIELAKYRIKYVSDAQSDSMYKERVDPVPAFITGTSDTGDRSLDTKTLISSNTATPLPASAVIKILNGIRAGSEIALIKPLTTIGRPGVQVAVITHLAGGYCITHVEGEVYPSVNGESIGPGAYSLRDGDVINLSGTEMVFAGG